MRAKWDCHLVEAASTLDAIEWNLFATDFASYVLAPPKERCRLRREASSFLRFGEVVDAEERRLAEGSSE